MQDENGIYYYFLFFKSLQTTKILFRVGWARKINWDIKQGCKKENKKKGNIEKNTI